jgi:hypothetical protein
MTIAKIWGEKKKKTCALQATSISSVPNVIVQQSRGGARDAVVGTARVAPTVRPAALTESEVGSEVQDG